MEEFNIDRVLESLSKQRPVFANKRDFKAAFIEESLRMYPSLMVKAESITHVAGTSSVDMILSYGQVDYSIVLFYKARGINIVFDGIYFLAPDTSTATNQTLCRFWGAMQDLEAYRRQFPNNRAYIIFLTNDVSYIKSSDRDNKRDDVTIWWGRHVDPDTYSYDDLSFKISNPYDFKWSKYSDIEELGGRGKAFFYLTLSIKLADDAPSDDSSSLKSLWDLQKLNNLTLSSDQSVFYRGQLGLNYPLLPSVLRANKPKDYERNLFISVISQHPDEYNGITNLQRLSKMQHYLIPTRMMDVSSNPQVSMFFAVSSFNSIKEDKFDGLTKDDKRTPKLSINSSFFFRFPVAKDEIKAFDSDTCRILSALPFLNSRQQQELRFQAMMDHFIQAYVLFMMDYHGIKTHTVKTEIIANTLHIILQNLLAGIKDKESPSKALSDCKSSKNVLINEIRIIAHKKAGEYFCPLDSLIKPMIHKIDKIIDSFDIVDDSSFDLWGVRFICKEISSISTGSEDKESGMSQSPNYIIFYIDDPALISFLEEYDHSPFYINPETGEYANEEMLILHAKVLNEYPSFKMCLRPIDLLNGTFVSPVSTSDRMVAQQGSFMLFGLSNFWNVGLAIRYFGSLGKGYDDILKYLIFNDYSFLVQKQNAKDGYETSSIKSFLKYVMKADVYEIANTDRPEIKKQLKFIGINKATMGRSPETTAYEIDDR